MLPRPWRAWSDSGFGGARIPASLSAAACTSTTCGSPARCTQTFVRSHWAHARIVSVDASPAAALDGVQVFTAADVDLPPNAPAPFIGVDPQMHRPLMASDKVRFAGEIVAAVLAETREASADAAELVEVEYEPLPVVTDPRDAVSDEVLLFEGLGTNVCHARPLEADDDLFQGCAVVSTGSVLSPRLGRLPDRAARDLGGVRRRRTPDGLALDPDCAPGQAGSRADTRPGGGTVVAPDVGAGSAARD
jgi:aerobic carbon-monoxide dehydrogenase large subunit